MINNSSLIKVIKHRMAVLNLNQTELAKKLNEKPSYVNRILREVKILNIDEINLLATALETDSTSLILEASKFNPEMTFLPEYQEEIILDSDLSYELWNLLSVELSEKEIIEWFSNYPASEIIFLINKFLENDLISKTQTKNYIRNTPHEKFIHFTYTEKFIQRRYSIMNKTLRKKPNFKLLPPKVRAEWLKTQSDVFLVDYFTEEQLVERKELLKKVWNFIITQRSINTLSNLKNKDLKLHMFTLVDMEVSPNK